MSLADAAREYAATHKQLFNEQLIELVRIPSVSAESQHKNDVKRAAEWIARDLQNAGAENIQVIPTEGHPIIYADWLHAENNAKTVLIYGHYDVQPAAKEDNWNTEPFEPTVIEGVLYARGSSDDKGQMFVHLKALESYLKTSGSLPVNVKFVLEGEEEISSKHLMGFVSENKDLLKADVCIISDTGSQEIEQPAIVTGIRGLTYMEIWVYGPKDDLHSGGFGGIVHNPALGLAQILSKMHNPDNSISIPGFYDDIVNLSEEDRANLARTDVDEQDLKELTGIAATWGEAGFSLRERLGARPTFEVNGILSGWTGEGSKTVLPAKAMAKVSCRLVVNQNPQKIYELVRDYVAQITPPTLRSDVKLLSTGSPALMESDLPEVQAAARAYTRGWGKEPVFMREGGSIPIVVDFQRELQLPVIMMGYGLNSDGAHGPNEHFSLEMFHRGIQTAICFLDEISR
ncbi:MAG: dipeptidase [Anaerolineae bacterium]|nr:dipeptidase [Anaerolineae bacterium]